MSDRNENFQKAVGRFRASLTPQQQRDFQVCSIQDVTKAIQEIDSHWSSKRQQRNMNRISKFIEAMSQLSEVMDRFLNVNAAVAFVWAPIKFILLAASTWLESLDTILTTYAEIGEILPGLTRYRQLLERHPQIQGPLEEYYCDVLDFHRKALDVFSRPAWKAVFQSSWRTFTTQFGPTLNRLKRHRDLLSDEKMTAVALEVIDMRDSIESRIQELVEDVQKLHLDDEDKALKQQESFHKRLKFVHSKLGVVDYQLDFQQASRERQNTPSGDWILQNSVYKSWVATTDKDGIIYLSGIPGAGKTILASRVIEHLNSVRVDRQNLGLNTTVLYFFFKQSNPQKRNISALLSSFLYQLCTQDDVVLDFIYRKYLTIDPQEARSSSTLRELASKTLGSQRSCFLIIDGLDECSDMDLLSRTAESQREIIDWLEAIVVSEDPVDHDSNLESRSIRLLISGQRNGILEERLSKYLHIKLEAIPQHENDIREYTEAKVSLIKRRNPRVSEDIQLEILEKVCSASHGMFLYAKVVLGNLLNQRSLGNIKRELKQENFPKGLDQAYERVAVYVLENPNEEEREAAKKILGYTICAERPMMWKELQSRFCISIDSDTADPDFLLSVSCKNICGSLVEIEPDAVFNTSPDITVTLVHETARIYLEQNRIFNISEENANMAIFCVQYLGSRPFSRDLNETDMKQYVLSGYYGFLDYAATNWWKHTKRIINDLDKELIRSLAGLRSILDFLNFQGRPFAVTKQEPTETDAIEILRKAIAGLPCDGREVEDDFMFEPVIRRIRAIIESIWVSGQEQDDLREIYGSSSFKCPKAWCHSFADGFDSTRNRDSHVKQHERPFRCDVDGCIGEDIGFGAEWELNRHKQTNHIDSTVRTQFPSFRSYNATHFDGKSLSSAISKGKLDIVKKCVAAGVDINAVDSVSGNEFPLFVAVTNGHYDICQYLLDMGAYVDARCEKSGRRALEAACDSENYEIIRLLIDYGAHTWLRRKTGRAYMSAFDKYTHSSVGSTLTKECLAHALCEWPRCYKIADFIRRKPEQEIMTHIDIHCGDLNWESGVGDTNLPLHLAIKMGYCAVTEKLIRSGRVDVNKMDCTGSLPLHLSIVTSTLSNQPQIFDHLLSSNKVDVNKVDGGGEVALNMAIRNLKSRVSVLVSKGADVNQKDGHGSLPLHLAIESRTGKLVQLLVSKGADINQQDGHGSLPLHLAIESGTGELVQLLVSKGADINQQDGHGSLPLHLAIENRTVQLVQLFVSKGADVNQKDSHGSLPLHLAIESGTGELIQLLVSKGADVNQKYDYGSLLLNFAMERKSVEMFQHILSSKMVDMNQIVSKSDIFIRVVDILFTETEPTSIVHDLLSLSKGNPDKTDKAGPIQSFINVTLLQVASYHLKVGLVEYILSTADEIAVNEPCYQLPQAWAPLFNAREGSDILRTPLFLAMNSSQQPYYSGLGPVQGVMKAILLTDRVDLCQTLTEYDQIVAGKLIRKNCDSDLLRRMVRAGLPYLPWDTMKLEANGSVHINADDNGMPAIMLTKNEVIDVICQGKCRLSDVAKANFPLARATLLSERTRPISLNFGNATELLELIKMEGNNDDLQAAIRLGIDCNKG